VSVGSGSTAELRQRRQTKLLVLIGWSAIVLPQVVQSLTAPKRRASVEAAAAGLTHLASLARLGLTLALICFAGWVVISSARSMLKLRLLPLIVLLAPWVYLVIRDWYVTGRPAKEALLVPLVILALWALQPRMAWLSTLGYLTVAAALVSIVMGLVDPSSAIYHSAQDDIVNVDKQILPGGMLIGFLTQPNSLAKFIVLGLPAVFLIQRVGIRAIGLGVCAFALVWTASRTSMFAGLVACVMYGVLALVKSKASRRVLSALGIAISMAVAAIIPFVVSSPTAFTNRGLIWQGSLPYWHAAPWFGQGADFYGELGRTSAAIAGAAFHAHNQVVQFLVTGGIFYVVVAGAMLWFVAVYAVRQIGVGSMFGVVYMVTLAGTFAMEIPFPTVDNTTMIPVALIPLGLIAFSRDTPNPLAQIPASSAGRPVADVRDEVQVCSRRTIDMLDNDHASHVMVRNRG
jgi:O-antigen ligase